MRFSRALLLVLLLVTILLAGGWAAGWRPGEGAQFLDQIISAIAVRFVDSTSTGDLYAKAARGLVHELHDPYAELVSPEELAAFDVRLAGRYGGVGLLIEDHDGDFVVMRVFPHTPGEQAGVLAGDHVLSVDSVDSRKAKFRQVTDAMRGPPGTAVTVRFSREGANTPLEYHLTRAIIRIPGVPYAIMLADRVGYIPLQQFTEKSGEEAEAAVNQLLAAGARGFVLDLRGNGGGYTDQALRVANLFLPSGKEIYRVRTRSPNPEVYTATRSALVPAAPLVVLTDGNSASASEIVAGALQDHDRALIVGTTSFGKGLVQTAFNLESGWVLKLTTGRWFTPSGRTIQKPRRLLPDGRLEEVHPDSLESDSARRARPIFKSDRGRVVYGGGGITPDLIVAPDTLVASEQRFVKALAPKSQAAYLALYDFAMALRPNLRSDFRVDPAWREDYYRRLKAKGVDIDRAVFDGAQNYVDRLIGNRVARIAFGDSAARRRSVEDDAALTRALRLMRNADSQGAVFAAATGGG